MTKDRITAVSLDEVRFEWTTLSVKGGRMEVADKGRFDLRLPGKPGEETAEGAEPVSAQIRTQCKVRGEVTLGLASDQALLRVVKLPDVSEEELTSMVQLQVDKFSPFPVESLVVSHEVLERKDGNARVLVAAVKSDLVDGAAGTIRAAGLHPVRVDVAVLGWLRLLQDSGEIVASGRQIFLLLTDRTPELVAFHNGVPIMFRTLSGKGSLSDEDFAGEIIGEIDHTLMTLELEHDAAGPCRAVVWHAGKLPEGMEEKLKADCPCELVMKPLAEAPALSEGMARRSADAGAMVDLTTDAWKTATSSKVFRRQMLMAAAGVIGAWLLGAALLFFGMLYQQKKLERLKDECARLQTPAKEANDIKRRVEIIRRYSDRTTSVLECLRELTEFKPEGLDLTEFNYKRATAPGTISIRGEAPSTDLVYDFKKKIEESKLFPDSTITGPSWDPRRGKQIFQIDIKLRGSGA